VKRREKTVDWCTREVLGSHVSMRSRTKEWLEALSKTLNKKWTDKAKSQGIKLVSDNRSQSTSKIFSEFYKSLEREQVFITYNNPKDNVRCPQK
jgi:transposase InsO family protein